MDTIEDRIQEVLPGATVRPIRDGLQVGGFSCPPVVAQERLRAAGLAAWDYYGATVVALEGHR